MESGCQGSYFAGISEIVRKLLKMFSNVTGYGFSTSLQQLFPTMQQNVDKREDSFGVLQ